MATVTLKPINELFDERFFVPSYQRGYRWTNVQVEELLEDLFDFAESKRDDNDYYCLQPIIVKKKGDYWELVDGQQRLTAFWLISALYYCSNREDEIDLEYRKYKLKYEEKSVFTELFSKIENLIETETMPSLVNLMEDEKEYSIDSRNLIESIKCIAMFTRKNKRPKGVLAKIFEVVNDIQVIWYVLDDEEDTIQTFTNINANKIELTNAELIKAVLLNACLDDNRRQNMALQWEDIEKGLNSDSFWSFIVDKKRNSYSTRIDYLFEIWCVKAGLDVQNTNDDRHAIFRTVSSLLQNQAEEKVIEIWRDIQNIYETLQDWYDDYFYYHTIGLLIIINEKEKDVNIINSLYKIYAASDKNSFRLEILTRIKNQFFGSTKGTPFEEFALEQIRNSLGDIGAGDVYVRNVLLLYNIAMLVNANNKYERFPFELYKNETWDIEHINPQTPKGDVSADEKETWLKSYLEVLNNGYDIASDPDIIKDIEVCIDSRMVDFELLANRIVDLLGIIDNNSITNLVLLDSSTNRGYKNACFVDKRRKVIEVERRKNNEEKYVPIGTKWVFLKGYENSIQLVVWGAVDMQDYSNDIANNIYKMLGGLTDE